MYAYDGTQSIVGMAGAGGGVDTLFDGGGVYFSPNGRNLGGGGNTVRAYTGTQSVTQMVSAAGGVETQFDDQSIYFSPNGQNLGGGGATTVALANPQADSLQMVSVAGGVDTLNLDAHNCVVYFSPNGLNLAGGGRTVVANLGPLSNQTQFSVTQILSAGIGVEAVGAQIRFEDLGPPFPVEIDTPVAVFSRSGVDLEVGGYNAITYLGSSAENNSYAGGVAGGVVTYAFGNQVYFSPDGLNLQGGGDTVVADNGPFTVERNAKAGIGIDSLVKEGNSYVIYFSPDGRNLNGGGSSVLATSGSSPVSIQSSGIGVEARFDMTEPNGSNSILVSSSVYFSPTGRNLDGGDSTILRRVIRN